MMHQTAKRINKSMEKGENRINFSTFSNSKIENILKEPVSNIKKATNEVFAEYNKDPGLRHIVEALKIENPLFQLPFINNEGTFRLLSLLKQEPKMRTLAAISKSRRVLYSALQLSQIARIGIIQLMTGETPQQAMEQIHKATEGESHDVYHMLLHERVHNIITRSLHKVISNDLDFFTGAPVAGRHNSIIFFDEVIARITTAEYFGSYPSEMLNPEELYTYKTMSMIDEIVEKILIKFGISPPERNPHEMEKYDEMHFQEFINSHVFQDINRLVSIIMKTRAKGKDYLIIATQTAEEISSCEEPNRLTMSDIINMFEKIANDTPTTLPTIDTVSPSLFVPNRKKLLRLLREYI